MERLACEKSYGHDEFLLEATNSTLPAPDYVRRVEITEEDLLQYNIQHFVFPPLRLIVSYKDLVITEAAINWMHSYSQLHNIEMRVVHGASTGFHVLEVLGEVAEAQSVIHKLLTDSPIAIDGYFAAFVDIQDDSDTENPVGLNRAPEMLDTVDWETEPE